MPPKPPPHLFRTTGTLMRALDFEAAAIQRKCTEQRVNEFVTELSKFHVDSSIKEKAIQLYRQLCGNGRRNRKIKHSVFALVYLAHLANGRAVLIRCLAHQFGIDNTTIFKIIKDIHLGIYNNIPLRYYVVEAGNVFYIRTGKKVSDELLFEMTRAADFIVSSQYVRKQSPDKCAIAILYYFLTNYGYKISQAPYCTLFHYSDTTISSVITDISIHISRMCQGQRCIQ